MEGLHYTMGVYQITDEERSITEVLDDLLDQQLNDLPQIEKYVAAAKRNPRRWSMIGCRFRTVSSKGISCGI
jgi:hypothetical protein